MGWVCVERGEVYGEWRTEDEVVRRWLEIQLAS